MKGKHRDIQQYNRRDVYPRTFEVVFFSAYTAPKCGARGRAVYPGCIFLGASTWRFLKTREKCAWPLGFWGQAREGLGRVQCCSTFAATSYTPNRTCPRPRQPGLNFSRLRRTQCNAAGLIAAQRCCNIGCAGETPLPVYPRFLDDFCYGFSSSPSRLTWESLTASGVGGLSWRL